MTETTLTRANNPIEYMNLQRAAEIMTAMEDNDTIQYMVEDSYLDFGAHWMWTTIIAHDITETGVLSRWQAINPRQWKEIIAAETKSDLLDVLKNIINK